MIRKNSPLQPEINNLKNTGKYKSNAVALSKPACGFQVWRNNFRKLLA